MEDYEQGLTVEVYATACGVGFSFGWDPGFIMLVIGPFWITWVF